VNIASTNSYRPQPGQSAYTSSKFAVAGITKAAAIEYAGDGIRVNSVGPGFIATPLLNALPVDALAGIAAMHPMNRLGTAEEVAALVLFLASPESSFITGGYYPVDGGYLAR
jgi:NAD(P)-dependent dehydrogenase (short-subunit alcohol dehydrogenase family)